MKIFEVLYREIILVAGVEVLYRGNYIGCGVEVLYREIILVPRFLTMATFLSLLEYLRKIKGPMFK